MIEILCHVEHEQEEKRKNAIMISFFMKMIFWSCDCDRSSAYSAMICVMILCIHIYWIFYNYIWNLLSSPQENSFWFKVEKIYVDSLVLIPSASPSVKIQIIGGKVFCFQKFVYNAQQCFAFTPQADFPSYNLNFIEGESDEIKSRPPFKIFSTLKGKIV